MTIVEVSAAAFNDLDRLIGRLDLPDDTLARVERSLLILRDFPLAGKQFEGRWESFRFLVGSWPWLILAYEYDEKRDTATIVTIQDRRASP